MTSTAFGTGLAALGLVFVGGVVARADFLTVPGDYATIQAAIEAAPPGSGDLGGAGRYVENIDFLGKALVIEGSGLAPALNPSLQAWANDTPLRETPSAAACFVSESGRRR